MWNHPHDQGPYLATTGEQHAANSATDQEAAEEAERTGEAAGREAEEAEKPQQGGRSGRDFLKDFTVLERGP